MNQLLCAADASGRCRGLPTATAARFAAQVLLALVHLHEAYGIIYRDVKPKNVLLSAQEEALVGRKVMRSGAEACMIIVTVTMRRIIVIAIIH